MIEITTEYTEVRINGAYYAQVPTQSLETWVNYTMKQTMEQAARAGMTTHPVTERWVVFYRFDDEVRPTYEEKISKLAAVRAYKKILRTLNPSEVGWEKQRSLGNSWITS